MPFPGEVGGDPGRDGLVVAVTQIGEEVVVQAGLSLGASGFHCVDRGAQDVGDLAGPDLGGRVDAVGVVQYLIRCDRHA